MIEKTKEDRVKEAIVLLKKLPAAGISKTHDLYARINERLSEWVQSGSAYSENIDLGSHVGILILPILKSDTITFHMKAKK